MFEAWKKRLAETANEVEEEITFRPLDETKTEIPTAQPKSAVIPEKNSSIEGSNIELKVVRPETMNEIFTIADHLIAGCTVVLNLELLDRDTIKRMLDFLNGVTYTKGGEIKNVAQGTYIITPTGININE